MSILGTLSSTARLAAVGLLGTLCAATAARAQDCPGHPDAIGTSRVIAISPADYPRVGLLQYPRTLPLNDHEVVLTFDDGPLPPYSTQVLDILAANCVKALFFNVGEMARAYPAVTHRVHDDGHTLGTHSETHPHFDRIPVERVRQEIDEGIANVAAAAGDPSALAPFFRIPGLARTDIIEQEAAARGLTIFSVDGSGDDWHRHITPAKIVSLSISRLEDRGKGILLLHDIHPWTVAALPDLFKELKAHGYHIVQVVPAGPGVPETIATDDEAKVAWSMAAQDVMDDSGATPSWPSFELSSLGGPVALAAPDVKSFDVNYVLAPMASTAKIESASAAADADTVSPWPSEPKPELSSVDPQLAAPSVADIGWPVEGPKRVAREHPAHEPRVRTNLNRAAAVSYGRYRLMRPQVQPVAHTPSRAPATDRHRASVTPTAAPLFTAVN
jgi:peptidoglycan/xylan/chitin deacetylase (PgdA/CDA1 family)